MVIVRVGTISVTDESALCSEAADEGPGGGAGCAVAGSAISAAARTRRAARRLPLESMPHGAGASPVPARAAVMGRRFHVRRREASENFPRLGKISAADSG